MTLNPLGTTGIVVPSITFGTSALGNLYTELDPGIKQEIIRECMEHTQPNTVFDSAGKYGAGLALEVLADSFQQLDVSPENIVVSNKLGWLRTPLLGDEPLFEPGVWKGLKHDAVQKISYHGILRCFEEGVELLRGFVPQLVSVHDPDEYLAGAKNKKEEEERFEDILEAYRALGDLKREGKVKGVGIGAKDWKVIPKVYEHIKLDWVMFANSATLISHPPALLDFMGKLSSENVGIFNSAVFQSGFLVGGDYFDYRIIRSDAEENKKLFRWRDGFFQVCKDFEISPAHACIQFALNLPGVTSVALSTTDPTKVKTNVEYCSTPISDEFWNELKQRKLLAENSPI